MAFISTPGSECIYHPAGTAVAVAYLDCLIFDRMIGIVHILQRDAVELSLVDVRDAVVFASLG